jgi:DNA repair protein RecO
MLELTDALTAEEGEAAEAYRVLLGGLEVLSKRFADAGVRQAFEMRLLRWAGFGLEFARCRVCGNAADESAAVHFVVSRGGIVCGGCRSAVAEGAIKLSGRSAAILARLGSIAMIEAAGAEAAGPDGSIALARFISSILDRRLRSQEFLDSILR